MSDTVVRALLAGASLLVFALFVAAITIFANVHLSDTMIGVILGYVGALVKDAYNFYFGTSAGSTAKDSVIAQQAQQKP